MGTLKVNFDTGIMDSFSAQAAVGRNFEGCILKAVSLISPPSDPSTSEALACSLSSPANPLFQAQVLYVII